MMLQDIGNIDKNKKSSAPEDKFRDFKNPGKSN